MVRYKLKRVNYYIKCPILDVDNHIIESYHNTKYNYIAEDFVKDMLENNIENYDENVLEFILVYIKKENDKKWTKVNVNVEIDINFYSEIIEEEDE